MDNTRAFNEAVATMNNIREAAKNGDEYAKELLKMADANHAGFIFADLSKYRPKRDVPNR